MRAQFENDPKHVAQILDDYNEFLTKKGRWPRGHFHERAGRERCDVTDFCPPLSEMPEFVKAHKPRKA